MTEQEQDAEIVGRIQESPDRKVFDVNVGDISIEEAQLQLGQLKRDFQDSQVKQTIPEVVNDNDTDTDNKPDDGVTYISPEQMAIENWGRFCTLQVGQDPVTGEIQMGIIQIPVPIDMINAFQDRMGEEMAKENMKFVVYKGAVFLAPVRTTTLLGFA